MKVRIKKIRVNFQVRAGYDKEFINFLKTIPKDQLQTTMDVIMVDGSPINDWFHICNLSGLAKILWYCQDKHIQYQYENIGEKDIWEIEQYVLKKKNQISYVKKIKERSVDHTQDEIPFMKLPPHPYQKTAIAFFEACNGIALLGDEPGVGKSLPSITYAVKNQFKTLVICPASLKFHWRNEVLRFTNEKAFIFKFKPKKKDNLIAYTPEESLIHIINYESLDTYLKFDVHHKCQNQYCDWEEISKIKKHKRCPKCFKEKSVKSKNTDLCSIADSKGIDLKINQYDLIVCDEAHYLKNPKAHRTKVITNAFYKVPKRILLSGTAIKNNPYEFFNLLNFLDPYEWVNAHYYGKRYCDGKEDDYGHWNYNGYSNLQELNERLSYLYLRRLLNEPGVMEHLPPKTYTVIPIELTPEERREYSKLEGKIIDETNESDDKMTHLARVQKLKQFTSKLNAERSIEFIQNVIDSGTKIVVFSQFIATTNYIFERFEGQAVLFNGTKSDREKHQAVESFMNDENIKVFVGTIGAAGVGITLTSAYTEIFIDQPWTPSDRAQAENRVYRASQTSNRIHIIRLIAQGTIDEDIDLLLFEKEKITSQVLDNKILDKKIVNSIFDDLIKIIINKKYN